MRSGLELTVCPETTIIIPVALLIFLYLFVPKFFGLVFNEANQALSQRNAYEEGLELVTQHLRYNVNAIKGKRDEYRSRDRQVISKPPAFVPETHIMGVGNSNIAVGYGNSLAPDQFNALWSVDANATPRAKRKDLPKGEDAADCLRNCFDVTLSYCVRRSTQPGR